MKWMGDDWKKRVAQGLRAKGQEEKAEKLDPKADVKVAPGMAYYISDDPYAQWVQFDPVKGINVATNKSGGLTIQQGTWTGGLVSASVPWTGSQVQQTQRAQQQQLEQELEYRRMFDLVREQQRASQQSGLPDDHREFEAMVGHALDGMVVEAMRKIKAQASEAVRVEKEKNIKLAKQLEDERAGFKLALDAVNQQHNGE